MLLKTKYVIVEGKGAILFPETFQHHEFKHLGEIEGAGFYHLSVDRDGKISVSVYGKSISLGILSKEEDLFWVKKSLGINH